MKKSGERPRSKRPEKVLLVRTSSTGAAWREPSPPCVIAPLGVLYLASSLRRHFGERLQVEVESLSTAVRSVEGIPSFMKSRRPDVVGISSSLVEENEAIALARAARQSASDPVVVVGGPYATCSPSRALERTGADFAVPGEGEETFVDLVRALRGEGDPFFVKGVARLDGERNLVMNGRPRFVENLDDLPHPAWDLLPIETYSRMFNFNDIPTSRRPYVPIMTSRGCPYRCSFCHNVFGKRFRARSPGNVIEEIEILHDGYGVGEFHVVDDIFNRDAGRMERLCRLVKRRGLQIALAFPNGMRGDLLTRERLELLKKAGCYSITMALESAAPRIRRLMRKRINLDRLGESARHASDLGIITSCFLMFGYPGETREEMETTIRWVRDSFFDFPRYCVASPFPGTLMAEHARKAGFDPDGMETRRAQYDKDNVGLADMPAEEFRALLGRGLSEILNEPRRRKRLEGIWSLWDRDSWKYFGFPPSRESEA